MKIGIGLVCMALWSLAASQGAVTRLNLRPGGIQSAGGAEGPAISLDGRFVAFKYELDDLVPGDNNGYPDLFVADRITGAVELVSVSSAGVQGNGRSGPDGGGYPSISADGRFVGFASNASNLVPGDTNGHWDIFVRDRLLGLTTRVSVVSGGGQTDSWSIENAMSGDGRYVAFLTRATNMGYGSVQVQANLHDRVTGQTILLSNPAHNGVHWLVSAGKPSVSADGRYVSFTTSSPLLAEDTNEERDIYVYEIATGTKELASVATDGTLANSDSGDDSAISQDGRYVVFSSVASNLVAGDTNGVNDIFLRDRVLGETTRISVNSKGAQGNGLCLQPSVSVNGNIVTFTSSSTNLVPNDLNNRPDVFIRNRSEGTTGLIAVNTAGVQGNDGGFRSSLSGDGSIVSFESASNNLVPEDTNGAWDLFARDLGANVVAPVAFQVFRGSVLAGNLQSLLASDDDRLAVRPGPVFTTQDFPVQIWLDFSSTMPNPSRIEIYSESSASSASIVQGIDLFNFNTNSFVELKLKSATTIDQTIPGFVTESVADFVGPSGLIRARVRFKAQGPVFAYPWQGRLDHVYAAIWPTP